MCKIILTLTLLTLTASSYSQSLLNDSTVVISVVQMDTIAVRLIRYNGLIKENKLLKKDIADYKLINEKQATQIVNFQTLINNKDYTIQNLNQAITEMEIVIGESEHLIKHTRKQVRKRWVIISVAALIGGFTTAILVL
jgi:actin-related protein